MSRPEVLNSVFREHPKYIALGVSMLGDGSAAERVFRELLVALDERVGIFGGEDELEAWCWHAIRNRLMNLVQRGDGRRLALGSDLVEACDQELRARDALEVVDQSEALNICLSGLPYRFRWTAHLFFGNDKGGLETARLLNLKPDQVYRDLQKIYAGGTQCLLKRIAMGRTPLGRVRTRNAEFERLVFRYLDDELAEEGLQQLTEAMLADADRIRQFNDIRLFSVLVRDIPVLAAEPGPDPGSVNGIHLRLTGSMIVSLVAAIVILAGLAGTLALIKLNNRNSSGATFARVTGARFVGRETPRIDANLDSEDYTLTTGAVQLRFTRGAEVNIEAPATFRVDAEDRLFLHNGVLLAMVSEPAKGFEVASRFGTVRDLGTEFGMMVRPDSNHAEVVVFQGLVEISGHGSPATKVPAGAGKRLSPDGNSDLVSSEHAYRYPRTLPSSDTIPSSRGLATNFSFEVGPLSRAPYASHRYRDIPSHWDGGFFLKERWKRQVEVPNIVNLGTAVTPFSGSKDLWPSDGERCLFLNGAAVRQRIESLQPGVQYALKFKVAVPTSGELSFPATYRVGFLAGDQWIESAEGTVMPGSELGEVEHMLSTPDDEDLAKKKIYLALSSENGIIFFDEIELLPLFGAGR